MRIVLVLLVIAVVAGFAAQNWAEITRSSELMFGPVVMTAPLGLILLSLAALALILFIAAAYSGRTRLLTESRDHHKRLEAQRDLAERAEASRFTELRQHLDSSMHELRMEVAQLGRNVQNRFGDMEARLDGRNRGGTGWTPAPTVVREGHETHRPEHALAQAPVAHARTEELRDDHQREERERDERLRADKERRPGLFGNWR